jgi:uncharacterized membrane protein
MKYRNFILIFIGIIGGLMLSNLVSEVGVDVQQIARTVFWVFMGLIILFLIYWYGIKKMRYEWIQEDERTRAIVDKSARNAFIVTWLTMFIFVDFGAPDTSSLLVAVAAGLVVYIVSGFIYNFKSG